ncbi:MAG: hypothetical protein C5B49_08510 [Bdellovibrio sp.]|nr:MAG: hypothetical protein C5B49_08510 [Bdellovibrio sp.]
MRKRIAHVSIFATGLVLTIGFSNCSKVSFDATTTDLPSTSVQGGNTAPTPTGAIQINQGAEYTNSAKVTLNLDSSGDKMYVTDEADCAAGGDWEDFVSAKPWTLKQLNAKASVFAKFKDSTDGSETGCLSASIIHDDVAPVITLGQTLAPVTNNPNVAFSFQVTDNLSGVANVNCNSDAGWNACPGTAARPLDEGNHTVTIQATDMAGNTSPATVAGILVDLTPPTVQFSQTPPVLSGSALGTFSFAGQDALSGVAGFECQTSASAAWQPCASPFTGTFPAGSNQFSIRATDVAGNVSTPLSYTWTIDLNLPTVTITSGPNPFSNQTSASFTFVGTDGGTPLAVFECSVDSSAFQSCSSPFTANGLTDGSHVFEVHGINAVGTVSQPAIYKWLVDTIKPTVTLVATPANPTSSSAGSFQFTAQDSGSGVKGTECQIDGGGFKPCVTGQSYSNLTDGVHTFDVRATDNAGNVGDPVTYTWLVDLTPPTVIITSGPASLTNSTSATLTFVASDGAGLVTRTECSIDGSAFAACTSPENYLGLAQGAHVFQVRAVDAVGLVSAVQSWSWSIDTTGPTITFTSVPANLITATSAGTSAVVQFVVSDSGTAVSSIQCGLNGTLATCANNTPQTLANLTGGNYTFTVQAQDSLGNTTTQSISFTVQIQSCTLQTLTVPVKIHFVVDMSGSNASGQGSLPATDPTKSFRGGEIKDFVNTFGTKTNFSWGFETFANNTATNLVGSSTGPFFTNYNGMQTAITKFYSTADGGNTPYGKALTMAALAIASDTSKTSDTKYIVVFLSDGFPTDVTNVATLDADVQNILNQAPGQVTFSTVFYGSTDATASSTLQSMATTGKGQFVDMNTYPSGQTFTIQDVINVPGPGCTQ